MKVLNILPECFVDTKVAEIISNTSGKYNHQHGCGQIARILKNNLKDSIALGIIDEDKNKGPIANYFREFAEIRSENGLILKKHTHKKQYLILICPEIEEWLIANANQTRINIEGNKDFVQLKNLKQFTKTQGIDNNIEFYRFIKSLMRAQASGIVTLNKWIEAFKNDSIDDL